MSPERPPLASVPLTDRLVVAGMKKPLPQVARRALMEALDLIAYAVGAALAQLRSSPDPLIAAHGRTQEHVGLVSLYGEIVGLLGERWDKVPDAHRPRYTPCQRFRILRLKRLMGLSPEETARVFRVSGGTVYRWQADMTHADEAEIPPATRLVETRPPVRRYADVVRHAVQAMALCGFGGHRKIASTLARAGWKISASSVARYLHSPRPRPQEPRQAGRAERAVRAKYVNHVWMMDLTHVAGLFGLIGFKVATVLDVFSRFPIAVRVFTKEPTAGEVLDVMQIAMRQHGRPRHLVTGRGSQFTDSIFRETLEGLRIKQRFGAVGKHGSVGIIDRFFRTLKESLGLPLWKPLLRDDLEHRLAPALAHFALHRPHQALQGATPAEVFLGLEPAHLAAIQPPRGQPGEGPMVLPFRVEFLADDQQRFPVLRRVA